MSAIGVSLKKAREFSSFALILLLSACGGGGGGNADRLPVSMALRLEPINTSLSAPLFLTTPAGDTTRLFVVEKDGVIKIIDLASPQGPPTVFLDVSGDVNPTAEQGLLGLAFHPDFAQNGFLFVNLINNSGDTEIRRYHVTSAQPNQADPASEFLIIRIDQPAGLTNHKAGWLGFGPDGFLYAALGDGGGSGDPSNNAQNPNSLLGKMLRLDIDADDFPADTMRNYAIPAGNPFVGQAGTREEIWSIGLRNPWRPSFDRGTGDFYIADVGQDNREEVNVSIMSAGVAGRGLNYGWNIVEGTLCYPPGTATCNTAGLTPPVVEYNHTEGCSITGGYVYRGTAVPAVQGTYFYADFCAGFVRSFRFVNGQVIEQTEWPALRPPGAFITSFGEDAAGELYIMTSGGGLFRIVPN
jgi:glucose/arabinose dehydrogenase